MKVTLLEAAAILAIGIATAQLQSRNIAAYPVIVGDTKLTRAEAKAVACLEATPRERQASACRPRHPSEGEQ